GGDGAAEAGIGFRGDGGEVEGADQPIAGSAKLGMQGSGREGAERYDERSRSEGGTVGHEGSPWRGTRHHAVSSAPRRSVANSYVRLEARGSADPPSDHTPAAVDAPWHFLYFFPEPQGHRSLRPTFSTRTAATGS